MDSSVGLSCTMYHDPDHGSQFLIQIIAKERTLRLNSYIGRTFKWFKKVIFFNPLNAATGAVAEKEVGVNLLTTGNHCKFHSEIFFLL